jgi:hypothetical protein
MGPPKNGVFYGGNTMTKYFRFTIELKAQVQGNPGGIGTLENIERTQRLVQQITADEKALLEVYKAEFLNLLLGDGYSEDLRNALKLRTEAELILPAAQGLSPQDSEFFTQLLTEPAKEGAKVDKDNVMNLFYSQFGTPDIKAVNFECIEK